MSAEKPRTSAKRSATEYRLSITSNPGSRRSSLGGTNESGHSASAGIANRQGPNNGITDDDENLVQEYILPQIREFSDSMITLDANFTQLNFIHESLVDLNESLGALLYGFMCNSWCVDFPHVSHDIEGELATTKRLESLLKEKESLLQRLNDIKHDDTKQNIADSVSVGKPQFVQPLFPSTQLRKPHQRSQPNHRISNQPKDAIYYEQGNIEEDENNSEASFISNPTMEFSNVRRVSVNKGRSNDMGKLRRKSILHTIRNSIASTIDPNSGREYAEDANIQTRNRISLGGSATRIVTNSPPSKRPNTMINGHAAHASSLSKNLTTNASDNARGLDRRPRQINDRPPFR